MIPWSYAPHTLMRKEARISRGVLISLLTCGALLAATAVIVPTLDFQSLAGTDIPRVIRWSLAGLTLGWAMFYRRRPR